MEKYEYGYLNIVSARTSHATPGTYAFVQTGAGLVVSRVLAGNVAVFNGLGAEGWLIGEATYSTNAASGLNWMHKAISEQVEKVEVVLSTLTYFMRRRLD